MNHTVPALTVQSISPENDQDPIVELRMGTDKLRHIGNNGLSHGRCAHPGLHRNTTQPRGTIVSVDVDEG